MSDFFDFGGIISDHIKDGETVDIKKIKQKKSVVKKPKKLGKCQFIDDLILKGIDKQLVLEKVIKKFPEDDEKSTIGTVNARFSNLKDNIPKPKYKPHSKIDIEKTLPDSKTPFYAFYNKRKDDYDYYYQ